MAISDSLGGLGNFLTGAPASSKQFSTISPQQQGLKGAVNQQALSMLQGLGGNQFNFAPIAQQARSQFNTQTVPGLAERFTSLGNGSQRSSAFQGALSQGGSGLEQALASLQSQFGLQQQEQNNNLLTTLLGFGLQPEVDTQFNPEQQGFLQNGLKELTPYLTQILGTLIGSYFGVPGIGGAAGSAAGSGINAITSAFGG